MRTLPIQVEIQGHKGLVRASSLIGFTQTARSGDGRVLFTLYLEAGHVGSLLVNATDAERYRHQLESAITPGPRGSWRLLHEHEQPDAQTQLDVVGTTGGKATVATIKKTQP
jgi:hypothetical protein